MEMFFTLDKLDAVAGQLAPEVIRKKIVAFHGMMGSGKTTCILALCNEMNVTGITGSPTFSIINEYKIGAGLIYHIDLYRLKSVEEAVQALSLIQI